MVACRIRVHCKDNNIPFKNERDCNWFRFKYFKNQREHWETFYVLFNFKHNISKLGKLFRQQATVKSIKTFKNWSFLISRFSN